MFKDFLFNDSRAGHVFYFISAEDLSAEDLTAEEIQSSIKGRIWPKPDKTQKRLLIGTNWRSFAKSQIISQRLRKLLQHRPLH